MKKAKTEFSKRKSELAKVDNILKQKDAENKKVKRSAISK